VATTAPILISKTEPLLERARLGDELAWQAILEKYQVMLLVRLELEMPGFLRQCLSPEDVLQEAFLKAFEKIDSFHYEGEGSFRRWLRRIAQNELKNQIRSWRVERESARRAAGHALEDLPGAGPTPSQVLVRIDEHVHALEKMRDLSEEDQDLISMRFFEDLSWEEIGAVLDCCRETASQRFDRAIARLVRLVG